MTSHDVIVYHCLTCGRVVDAEQGAASPQCCGSAMVDACPESNLLGNVCPDPQATPPTEGPGPQKSSPRAP
jgi:predicted RNA-binding Zn-ribbon protein involved in translation (DUF1610 family)